MATTSKIAVGGGLVILAGGLALAFFTATSVPALKETKTKTVTKYSKLVDQYLAKGDVKQALKEAKAALKVDPTNKLALEAYKKVVLATAPKAVAPAKVETNADTKPTATQSAPKETTTPVQPAAEAEDEMGCI